MPEREWATVSIQPAKILLSRGSQNICQRTSLTVSNVLLFLGVTTAYTYSEAYDVRVRRTAKGWSNFMFDSAASGEFISPLNHVQQVPHHLLLGQEKFAVCYCMADCTLYGIPVCFTAYI